MLGRRSFVTILIGKSVLLRSGLSRILRSANFHILASVSCADDIQASTIRQQQPLFIVVHIGDDFDVAVEQIEFLKSRHPDGRVAVVADHHSPRDLVSAFRAGANGYFVDMTYGAFIKSLELVMMGETIFPRALLSIALDPASEPLRKAAAKDNNDQTIVVTANDGALTPQLSSRERSILRCLINGDSNKRIARSMDIAEATVKVHVKAILRKIRVQNRTQAAIWGANNRSLAGHDSCSPASAGTLLPQPVSAISEIEHVGTLDQHA
jgi:DNA-binding NarL/FixJ family response regulator